MFSKRSARAGGKASPPARTPFPWVAGGTIARHPVRTSFCGRGAKPTNHRRDIVWGMDSEIMRAAVATRQSRLAPENRAEYTFVHYRLSLSVGMGWRVCLPCLFEAHHL